MLAIIFLIVKYVLKFSISSIFHYELSAILKIQNISFIFCNFSSENKKKFQRGFLRFKNVSEMSGSFQISSWVEKLKNLLLYLLEKLYPRRKNSAEVYDMS